MEAQTNEKFEQWCVIEQMGHNLYAGFVSERVIAGTAMIQVDVPEVDAEHPAFSKLLGASTIYGITPTTEEHARQAAARIRQRPLSLYILPEPTRQLEARVERGENDEDFDDEGNPF